MASKPTVLFFFTSDADPQYVSRLQIMQKIQNDWVERGRNKISNAQTLIEDVMEYFKLGENTQYQSIIKGELVSFLCVRMLFFLTPVNK